MGIFFECISSDIIVATITLFLLLRLYYLEAHRYWTNHGVFQIPPSFPFGNLSKVVASRQHLGSLAKECYDIAKAQGHKFAGLYLCSQKAFLPIDPLLVRNILTKDFNYFADRGIYYDEVNDPLSAHLFSLEGVKWRNLRTKLSPAYTSSKIKYMFQTFADVSEQLVLTLTNGSKDANPVEMKDILARFSTDVIGSTAFGIECNSLKNPHTEFREMGRRAFTQTITDTIKIFIIRCFPDFARILKIGIFSPTCTTFFRKAVYETIEFREKNNVTRNDFMQLLIQLKNKGQVDDDNQTKTDTETCTPPPPAGTTLTMDEAAAQAFIFFLAGFETTATTMMFALFEMCTNPSIQERARKELMEVLQKHDGILTYDAINDLQYLDMVVLETLRKHPPATVYLRICTKPYQIPDTDVVIPKDITVFVPSLALHRDPEYFPDPEHFDPERFNEENKSKIQDYTYIPFGDGPRICIGQRMAMIQVKIGIAQVLKNFKFTLNESRTPLPLKLETKGIITAPVGGIWLNLTKI